MLKFYDSISEIKIVQLTSAMDVYCLNYKNMKKQLFAYTRTYNENAGQMKGSNRQHSNDSSQAVSSVPFKESASIYHAVLGQMATNHCEYINKLLVKQDQLEDMPIKGQNRSVNGHERTKSYTNNIIEDIKANGQGYSTNLNSDCKPNQPSDGRKLIKNNMFFSHKNSPIHSKVPASPQSKTQQHSSKSFLNYLDNYIATISYQNPLNSSCKAEKIPQERKTVSKPKENTSYVQLLKKLESKDKKIKDLKLNNHILKIQETKHRKKNKDLKIKLHEMLEHMKTLNKELQKQKYERRKIQSFLKQFQQKVLLVCPQKQANQSYRNHKNCKRVDDYLIQENTTEQDEQIEMIFTKKIPKSDMKSRSIRKANHSGSKSYKYKQNQDFNQESNDSFYFPSKHFEDSEESQTPYL